VPAAPRLIDLLPSGEVDADQLLGLFVEWSMERGLELYPAQEEAILEVLADRHVILDTPTGSGKSLVALAMHLCAFARGERSVYTSPIKALVNEKFFDLCGQFGAENVGMLTGDASINPRAPVLACTAEILAAIALTEGDAASLRAAVLDEFHYYADRDRGMAWQIPLLTLTRTTFMLMSATLGDTRPIARSLEARTGRPVALVRSTERPVPLELSYSEEPLLETIVALVGQDRAPVYVVNFSQREAADLAGAAMSTNWCRKDEKAALAAALKGERFGTPYGKEIAKFLRHGVGVHHAGLLPRYRLLIERLAQQGKLKIISGTDTLGVGINVPIRTVLFTRLTKYDGQKTRVLTVRDFKQIAGRAGRKGHDDQGWVVCQAPEHVVENRKIERKIAGDPKKYRKLKRRGPPDGFVGWDERTFRRLIAREPEPLRSRFKVDHGMVISLLQGNALRRGGGYRALVELIERSHTGPGRKTRLRRESAKVFRQLRAAGIVGLVPGRGRRGREVRVSDRLQNDFSMFHSLSLFLIHAIGRLPLEPPRDYALRVCSFAEAILEDPAPVLFGQRNIARRRKLAELKAEGVEFDRRQEILEEIQWPMPDAELIFECFEAYAETRPWVRAAHLRPKSIARDMYERFASFNDYVKDFGLERSEGVLLRHLNQTNKVLVRTVPEALKTDELVDLIAWLRSTLQRADASLLSAWRAMRDGVEALPEAPEEAPEVLDVVADKKAFRALVRAELHQLVKALSTLDYDEAVSCVRRPGDAEAPEEWTAGRFAEAMRPFFATYDRLVFDHHARQPGFTRLDETGPRQWRVRQTLCDPDGDHMWYIDGSIDLRGVRQPGGPIVTLTEIRG